MFAGRAREILSYVSFGVLVLSAVYVHWKGSRVTPELRKRVRLVGAVESGVEIVREAARSGWIDESGLQTQPRFAAALESRLEDAGLTLVQDRVEGRQRTLVLASGESEIEIALESGRRGLRYVEGRVRGVGGHALELRALLDGVR